MSQEGQKKPHQFLVGLFYCSLFGSTSSSFGSKKSSGTIFHDQREPEGQPTGKWAVILPGTPYLFIKQLVMNIFSYLVVNRINQA